uniref:Candidate secreted effector n=1 Tax=Meloidogyne incognita TaxID=6306 RepID=A0A914MAY3_MELIC
MSVLKVSEFICGQLLRTEFLRTNIKLKQIVLPAAESGLRLEFFLGIWLDPSTKNSKTKKTNEYQRCWGI